MDGLLLDSERPVRDAWVGAAAELGIPFTNAAFLELVGRNHRDSRERLLAIFGDAAGLAKGQRLAAQRLKDQFGTLPFDVKPGALRLLQGLRGAGVPCAVASSTAHAEVRRRLGLAGLLDCFDAICGGDEVARGKPDPDIYTLALDRLGIADQPCLAFEDSGHGALAALAAGLAVVVVPDLKPPEPQWQLRSLAVMNSLDEACERTAEWFGFTCAPIR